MDFNFNWLFLLFVRPADRTEWSHNPPLATPAGYHTSKV